MKKLMKRIKNFFFCLRYPFWKVHNRWDGKPCGYAFTEYDSIPEGWQKAFGKQLSEDLRKAIKQLQKQFRKEGKKLKMKDAISWGDIKEKWGYLRFYASTYNEIEEVLDKYELLSICYCIHCGKPARYITKGWVSYVCEDCFTKPFKNFAQEKIEELKKESRLQKKHIPVHTYFRGNRSFKVNFKKKYGIDFKEMWSL